MKRSSKVLLSILSLTISYVMILSASFPFRASNDEFNPAVDIHRLLSEGSYRGVFTYSNGSAYQTGITSFLRIADFSYMDTSWLSPLIGAFVLMYTLLILLMIFRRVTGQQNWMAFVCVSPMIFVFPGYISRVRQTTHKAFTFSLVFLLLFTVLIYISSENSDWRSRLLVIIPSLALPFFNFMWALIYSSILLTPVIVIGIYKYFSNSMNMQQSTSTTIALVSLSGIYMVAYNLPTVLFRPVSFRRRLIGGLIVTSRTKEVTAGSNTEIHNVATGLINQWPMVTIGEFSFSIWFIYITGILFTSLITGICSIILLLQLKNHNVPIFGQQLLVVLPLFGILMIAFLISGDLSTFKRVIIVPGFLGMVYWSILLSRRNPSFYVPEPLLQRRKAFLALTMIVLIVSAGLAIPRITLDGNNKPLDKYAEQNQVSKVEWYFEYQSSCLQTHDPLDDALSGRIVGDRISTKAFSLSDDVIYSSGPKNYITC